MVDDKLIIVMIYILVPFIMDIAEALKPPAILADILVRGTTARLAWSIEEDVGLIKHFQITYELVNSARNLLRITHTIDGTKRSFTLRGLVPFSTYRVFMVTVGTTGVSNSSESIEFTSDAPDYRQMIRIQRDGLQVEEVVIILIVLVLWALAVVLFLRQWDNIRILQPMESRFKHSPKNLETIRVVKREQDSVIYKNYNRKLSVTMIARQKKILQRMHTAPVLPTMPRLITLPTIEMEDVTTEM